MSKKILMRENVTEAVFGEVMAKNFPKHMKDFKPQVQKML